MPQRLKYSSPALRIGSCFWFRLASKVSVSPLDKRIFRTRKYLTLLGNGHLPLGFDLVSLQIPLLSYPHNEGKPHVQRLSNESLGGIPAVKQQQTASQTKLRHPLHMPDGKIALICGVGGQLTAIYGMIQGSVGERAKSSRGILLGSRTTESLLERGTISVPSMAIRHMPA